MTAHGCDHERVSQFDRSSGVAEDALDGDIYEGDYQNFYYYDSVAVYAKYGCMMGVMVYILASESS